MLDEGFGTLDSATLDTVAVTLENLAARGDRMGGVVTHVAARAARIPVRCEVRRDARGVAHTARASCTARSVAQACRAQSCRARSCEARSCEERACRAQFCRSELRPLERHRALGRGPFTALGVNKGAFHGKGWRMSEGAVRVYVDA